jgi:hypothetical protein
MEGNCLEMAATFRWKPLFFFCPNDETGRTTRDTRAI